MSKAGKEEAGFSLVLPLFYYESWRNLSHFSGVHLFHLHYRVLSNLEYLCQL